MTRVAYVCADGGVPVFGTKGASVHVQEIVRALGGAGAQVELFAARFDGVPPRGLEGVPVHRAPLDRGGDLEAREAAGLASNAALRRLLEDHAPFDLVYERYSLWSHAGMEYARSAGIPGLLEVNAPLIDEQRRHRRLHRAEEAEDVARRAFGAAAALLAVSPAVAHYLTGHRATRGPVVVVPNGVDPARFGPRSRRSSADAVTIGFVGTLKPWHGLEILLDAFALLVGTHPSARLLVVGDGPERERIERRIDSAGLARHVLLTGAVPPETVPARLAEVDIAVAPYPDLPDFYFSPLKVFEYMAAGLPVAASRIGPLPELVRDGIHGLLCPPGDPVALAAALSRLAADPPLRRRMGREARAKVLREHTWDGVARRILDLAAAASARSVAA